MNPAAREAAIGPPPIRSVVAPDINPIGGGIVDDSQAADTSPGDGKTHSSKLTGEEIAEARLYAEENHLVKADPAHPHHPTVKDKVEGFANVVSGKMFDNPAKVIYGKAKAKGEV